jgi:ribosomal protein S18 acetylase RimI-like enzyme
VLRHPTSRLLVGDAAGDVVASMVAAWDGWRGSLYRLVVSPEHRRSGIGTKLVRAGEEWLTEQGARRIGLYVIRDARGAALFWERCGYSLEPRVARYVRMVVGDGHVERREEPPDRTRQRG